MTGKVILVGGGPSGGLITVRGMQEVRNAEVLVYDDLIDGDLLLQTKENCETIYVGKRRGAHSMKQEDIQELLIRHAKAGKRVVRLKGGDSFVFGRGGEECIALREAGIPVEVVPGVSSAVSVPELAGIPVTHRGVSRSFTVVTGHPVDGEDFDALAALKGTLVFLMAHAHMSEISEKLMAGGKDPDTPAAVISRGGSPDMKRVDGVLSDIATRASDLPTPSVLVVGEVASFHLLPEPHRPGRVLVTGTRKFVEKAMRRLQETDRKAVGLPCLSVEPLFSGEVASFERWDWLVFTSMNGVDLFFEKYCAAHETADARAFCGKKFACIGPGTAAELASFGIRADLVPEHYTSAALGKALAEQCAGERVLILRAEGGSKELNKALDDTGIEYRDLPLYQTVSETDLACDMDGVTDVVFASASGVRAFFEGYTLPADARIICIGEVTAREVRKYTNEKVLIAKEESLDGIVSTLCEC